MITINVDNNLEETPTDNNVAPKFIKPLMNRQVFENEKVTLEAVVGGSPNPSVRWEFEGKPLVENNCVFVENKDNVSRFVRHASIPTVVMYGMNFKQFFLGSQRSISFTLLVWCFC